MVRASDVRPPPRVAGLPYRSAAVGGETPLYATPTKKKRPTPRTKRPVGSQAPPSSSSIGTPLRSTADASARPEKASTRPLARPGSSTYSTRRRRNVSPGRGEESQGLALRKLEASVYTRNLGPQVSQVSTAAATHAACLAGALHCWHCAVLVL